MRTAGAGYSLFVVFLAGAIFSAFLNPLSPAQSKRSTHPCTTVGFRSGPRLPAGTAPVSVASADFNGDHKADLAVANSGSNDVWIFLGNSAGGLQLRTKVAVGKEPRNIVAVDLNSAHRIDLVVANFASNSISLLSGNGSGE